MTNEQRNCRTFLEAIKLACESKYGFNISEFVEHYELARCASPIITGVYNLGYCLVDGIPGEYKWVGPDKISAEDVDDFIEQLNSHGENFIKAGYNKSVGILNTTKEFEKLLETMDPAEAFRKMIEDKRIKLGDKI